MSTFYVVPSRPLLGERLARFLQTVLPGLDWDSTARTNLAETIAAAASEHDDVFVVYREDLPGGESSPQVLTDAFGAEAGDEVIEVRPGPQPGELTSRRWKVA